MRAPVSRREFLLVGGAAGGFMLALTADGMLQAQVPPVGAGPGGVAGPAGPPGAPVANANLAWDAFVSIAPSGAIRIYAARPDIGQGIKTSSAMIVAEEMDADWARVTVEQAPVDVNVYGSQNVGGSRSTPNSWDPLRRVGATARALLIGAAAQSWGVAASECTTDKSVVTHWPSRRTLGYGELALKAATLPLPDANLLKLKSRRDYKLLGTRVASVDNPKIVRGEPIYGMDFQLPGMVYASVQRAPVFRARVKSFNSDAIRQLPGVRDAFVLDGQVVDGGEVITGVVVVANSTWAAFSARKQLSIEWDTTGASTDSWAGSERQAQELAKSRGKQVLKSSGDVDASFAAAAKTVEGFYTYPFISHAPLEPQNTTAWFRDGALEMWAPVQTVDRARPAVAQLLGLSVDKVTVHLPRIGGGFGRRLLFDYMTEAALIAKRVSGPVKVVWTREDDLQYDYFRVAGFHALKGALDASGRLTGWQGHFITFTPNERDVANGGNLDPGEFPAPVVENVHMSQTMLPLAARTGPWRAPRSNGLAFPMQSFLHELAVAAGRDHVEFLLELFGAPRLLPPGQQSLNTGRAAAVLRLAAEKSGWGRKLPRGRGLGLAFYYSHLGHFAEVAEVSVSADKKLTVHKVTVVADIGLVLNPLGAEQQVQGSVMDGLSVVLGQRITFAAGVTQQQNFGDYPMMRIASAPQVAVHFMDNDYSPTGVGEPALPPVAPAICNAIFAATGARIRTLPLSLSGYSG
jgi:isoquinoline 1-oxidoreductase subunit beta